MEKERGLSANALKLIAIIAMTVDHVTWVIFPGYQEAPGIMLLHSIGRITAPTMCFFISEGYRYTHNIKKYALRLFAFAVMSHFAYNFAFGIPFVPFKTGILNQTGVMWALAWGLVALALVESEKLTVLQKTLALIVICIVSFPADWSCIAVLVIVCFGTNQGDFKKQALWMLFYVAMYAAVFFFAIDKAYGILQMAVVLSLPLLRMYNGERGKYRGIKWLFYWYYPLHLIACGILRLLLHGNIGVLTRGI
ncbi:MAG: conjugal transfer protein TraX [Clostridiales bacterium]|nr:conjugal transfer protein TraX [Clostridiales bacterium]